MEREINYPSQEQQGSGSAENRDGNRQDQQNKTINVNQSERDDIAQQAGIRQEEVADIGQLGGTSGREDYSGGNNDGMSDQSSGEATDR